MKAESLFDAFDKLSTALIADAALRLKVPFRISPPGVGPMTPHQRLAEPGHRRIGSRCNQDLKI